MSQHQEHASCLPPYYYVCCISWFLKVLILYQKKRGLTLFGPFIPGLFRATTRSHFPLNLMHSEKGQDSKKS